MRVVQVFFSLHNAALKIYILFLFNNSMPYRQDQFFECKDLSSIRKLEFEIAEEEHLCSTI